MLGLGIEGIGIEIEADCTELTHSDEVSRRFFRVFGELQLAYLKQDRKWHIEIKTRDIGFLPHLDLGSKNGIKVSFTMPGSPTRMVLSDCILAQKGWSSLRGQSIKEGTVNLEARSVSFMDTFTEIKIQDLKILAKEMVENKELSQKLKVDLLEPSPGETSESFNKSLQEFMPCIKLEP